MKKPPIGRAGTVFLPLILTILPLSATVIPVDLPPPDAKPPAKDKPVQVYIFSGQSNSVGFGAIKPGAPTYNKVVLCADPRIQPAALPVSNAAIVPLGIFQSAEKNAPAGAIASVYQGAWNPQTDYSKQKPVKQEPVALGSPDAMLPSINEPHTIVVEAFIDVPFTGNYEVHAGFEASRDCIVMLDGKEASRPGEDGKPVLTKVSLETGKRHPVRITYKSGGSAAFWLDQTDLSGKGDLNWVIDELGRFRHLRAADGSWVTRNDVILNDAYLGKGESAPLSVTACGPTFGPELGCGFVLGTFHDEPVLLIKSDIGNRSLGWDILPPGSKSYSFDGKDYPGYGETLDASGKIVKPKEGDWYAGKQYDDYTAAIRAVLDNFGAKYPEYKDQGYEVAGFVWWQGHKDGGSPAHIAKYEENMANLIRAWRKEFNAPKATWAIATVAFHGADMSENYQQIAAAQLAMADPSKHPEFAGNVKTIDARPFWREAHISPKNQDYHYNHNAETYLLVGDALGRAHVEMKGGRVEYPQGGMIKPIKAIPVMKISTFDELTSLAPVLKPVILDKLLPDFLGTEVPSYLRKGLPLENIVGGKKPSKMPPHISTQLDQVMEYYQLCGIDAYNWQPFGPAMRDAEWDYLTFDPAEKKTDPKGDRYREVTLPAGTENWADPAFDAKKAGWKSGKAPFGQKNGEPAALIESCKVPYCGCNETPATLWDKEVLLARQTFEFPKLDDGHRYRIVVGGAGHAWSGEGFALYLNGKLAAEVKEGYYKSGGQPRGALIFDDIKPEFAKGKVTIAIKAFLRQNGHRNTTAPPSGHISVWMESAKLPDGIAKP